MAAIGGVSVVTSVGVVTGVNVSVVVHFPLSIVTCPFFC